MRRIALAVALVVVLVAAAIVLRQRWQAGRAETGELQISGIYPHLAMFNDTGPQQENECGIGAVVPWAGKLWVITYPPHRRTGSVDKLY